jgi:hypothetical protein
MGSILELIKDEFVSIGKIIVTILTIPVGILATLLFCYVLLIIVSGLDKLYNLIVDFIEQIKRK